MNFRNWRWVKKDPPVLKGLMKFVRDKIFDRLIMLEKGKITSKLNHLRQRHKLSMTASTDTIMETSDGWHVPSFTDISQMYYVKEQSKCIEKECPLTCIPCVSCIHSFNCTCIDNSVQYNMCKHIHLVARNMKKSDIEQENFFPSGDLEINDTELQKKQEKADLISFIKQKDSSASDLKEKINAMCKKIFNFVDACSSESKLKSAYKMLKHVNDILLDDSEQNKFGNARITSEPANK